MKSPLHPFVLNLIGKSGHRYLAITATVTTFTISNIVAQDYAQTGMVVPDDPFNVQLPAVDEEVAIGGFQLTVDRTKWGIELGQRHHGWLGRFPRDDVDITVTELPRSRGAAVLGAPSTHRERIFTKHAAPGLKIVYGAKPSLLTQNIRTIRCLFVNREGETICFEARAKTANPDWSEANNLVLNTLSLPVAHRSSH